MTERKFIPNIQTKYKPYSCLRKMQLHIIGDYFNSTIERQQFGQQERKFVETPKKKGPHRVHTEPQSSPKIIQLKSELKQFSLDLPIMPVMPPPKQTVLKKKKGVQGFRILLNDAYEFFFEEFLYEMHQLDQNLTKEIAQQLAQKKWNQLDENEKTKYNLMAKSEKLVKQQENKQLHFQINYCSSYFECQSQMDQISNILESVAKESTIDAYRIPGKCKSVSVFLLKSDGRSQLIWHSLYDGVITKENEKSLVSRIENL